MSKTAVPRAFTGRHMALIMVAFFLTVISANMVLVVMAKRSWTGLVVANSYVASQHFDETTDALEKSAAMGIHARLHYAGGLLTVRLEDAHGQRTHLDQLVVALGRPAVETADRTLSPQRQADGSYSIATELGAGVWAGEITGRTPAGDTWKRPIRLIVKG